MPKAETEDIQLDKDLEEVELVPPTVLHQNDHKVEDLDAIANKGEKQAKDDNLAWAEG